MAEQHVVWQQPAGDNAAAQVRLVVDSPGAGPGLQVVRGRGDDYFIIAPDAGVVAAFVILDQAAGRSRPASPPRSFPRRVAMASR